MLIFYISTGMRPARTPWLWIVTIGLACIQTICGYPLGVAEMIMEVPILKGTLAVPLHLGMPTHLYNAIEQSAKILSTTADQVQHLKESKVLNKRLTALNLTLHHINDSLRTGIYESKDLRPRRALLDMGGTLLQAVFGVATDKDLALVKDSLINQTKQLQISQNKVTVITNVLKNSFIKLSEAMIDQNEYLKKSERKSYLKSKAMNTISLVGDSIMLINIIMAEYNKVIGLLRRGIVPRKTIPLDALKKIIKEGNIRFWGTKFADNKENISSHMIETITVHKTANPFNFVLHVPFISKERYTIFQLKAIPTMDKNQNLFIATNLDKYLGLSDQFYFSTKTKPLCNRFYCESELYLRKRSVPSCELDIITNQTGYNCVIEKFLSTKNYYVERLQSFWAVVFFEETHFLISCGAKESFRQSKGLLKVPTVCTLQTESFVLTSAAVADSKIEINKNWENYDMVEFDSTLSNLNISDHNAKSLTQMKQRLTKIKNETQSNMRELQYENTKFIKYTYIHMGFSLSGFVVIVGLLIFACVAVKKCKNDKNELKAKLEHFEMKRELNYDEKHETR